MIRSFFLGVTLLMGLVKSLHAQDQGPKFHVHPDIQFRSFWMKTSYVQGKFKEDYALGKALYLGARVDFLEKFSFQIGYRGITNVFSSDLWNLDPVTGQGNRYETGLFDILNPEDRLFGKWENLSLTYSQEKFGLKIGRMGVSSDWINSQDGRLSPTLVEGVLGWFKPNPFWRISIQGISRLNIRGSSRWLGIGESIGIFPQGRTESGSPGAYFGNTSSNWVGILEIDREFGAGSKLHFSNTYAQNLFSTYWLEFESQKFLEKHPLNYGFQAGFQHGLGDGGNPNPTLRYKNPKDRNFVISGKIAWKNSHWTAQMSMTQILGSGRWLSPREWGKDAWFTFIPRERNEGNESVTALVGYGEYKLEKLSVRLFSHMGFYWLPDLENAQANKYNFPSYHQLNLGVKYEPDWIQNLDIQLLWVKKVPIGNLSLHSNQIFNKVEMQHFNAILNWKWN